MYNRKSFFQYIFSVRNEANHKIITIFGFNFKFNRKNTFKLYKDLPVISNKIVFSNTNGKRGYGCNPKYIAEELIRQNLDYELVWLVDKKSKQVNFSEFPKQIKLVHYKSKDALKELATAKFWVDNQAKYQHVNKGLEKKDEQIYIQTWHGSMGIKKVGDDTKTFSGKITFEKEAKMIDYLISNSCYETEVFKRRFWNNGKILRFGHARNDIFFMPKEELQKIQHKIYELYNIKKDTKILIYAPTFRHGRPGYNDCYALDYFRILETCEKKYNCNFVIFTRLHHEMKNLNIPKSDKIIDVTRYGDIQELMSVSEIMISDYSSCMFDFMLSKRPCFIFASDLDYYNKTQGFYYPLETTPFPIAKNNDELISNILNFNETAYISSVEKFLAEKGCAENGLASKRVVKLICDEGVVNL